MKNYINPVVPQGLIVALYKGTRPGVAGLYNRLGRVLDHGDYSHTEIITTGPVRVSLSSTFMEGGVRGKLISYTTRGAWDFIRIPDPTGQLELGVWRHFDLHRGRKYDWRANIRFAFGIVRESPTEDFCSEFTMAALGFSEAWRYGPCGAARAICDRFNTGVVTHADT